MGAALDSGAVPVLHLPNTEGDMMRESTLMALAMAGLLVFVMSVVGAIINNDYWAHVERMAGCVQ